MAELTLHPKYSPLFRQEGQRYTMMTGGRGSGKSFALSLALSIWLRDTGRKVLFTRYTLTSAQDSIIPEFLEKLDRLGISNEFEATKASIRHRLSGSEIIFRGIKTSEGVQTAKLKSIQGINAWVLDEAEELPDEDTFDKIDLSVRDSRRPNRIILCLNPAHKTHWIHERFFKTPKDDCQYIHTDYRDNAKNLPADYVARAKDCKVSNQRKYEHIWLGSWLEEMEGALWTWKMMASAKEVPHTPQMRRIVVAIDPAATSTANADETGIVCAGLGMDGRYYVLSDLTMRGSPMDWASKAIAEYRLRKADRIVAEVNNGGEMVECTLRNVDKNVSYSAVHASRGKMVRAEPVAALYERGMVTHMDNFKDMEAELLTYTGDPKQRSPNRMDALVWALSYLSDNPGIKPLSFVF